MARSLKEVARRRKPEAHIRTHRLERVCHLPDFRRGEIPLRNLDTGPTFAGLVGLVAACITVSLLITAVTGTYAHWIPVLAGIAVGLWATRVM